MDVSALNPVLQSDVDPTHGNDLSSFDFPVCALLQRTHCFEKFNDSYALRLSILSKLVQI